MTAVETPRDYEILAEWEAPGDDRTLVLASGDVLSSPQVLVVAGEPATTTTSADGSEVEVTIFVTKGGGQVDLAVIVRRNGVKTAAQALTVKLPL